MSVKHLYKSQLALSISYLNYFTNLRYDASVQARSRMQGLVSLIQSILSSELSRADVAFLIKRKTVIAETTVLAAFR